MRKQKFKITLTPTNNLYNPKKKILGQPVKKPQVILKINASWVRDQADTSSAVEDRVITL